MTWSPGDVDVGILSLLVQFYPILLSTLLSVNRQQLSGFDAYFALILSSSPLTTYVVVASISNLYGIHTGLYKRIKSYRITICILGALVPLLWAGISMVVYLSPTAFKDSQCETTSFADWAQNAALSITFSFTYPGGVGHLTPWFIWVLVTPWLICLARRWSQLRADVKFYSEGASRLCVFWIWMKCAWCVAINAGP